MSRVSSSPSGVGIAAASSTCGSRGAVPSTTAVSAGSAVGCVTRSADATLMTGRGEAAGVLVAELPSLITALPSVAPRRPERMGVSSRLPICRPAYNNRSQCMHALEMTSYQVEGVIRQADAGLKRKHALVVL